MNLPSRKPLCLRSAWIGLAIALTALFSIVVRATPASAACNVEPNLGQCICHNVGGGTQENCPSSSGVVNGHDDHLAKWCCLNFPGGSGNPPEFCNFATNPANAGPYLDCSCTSLGGVQDTFGKCGGCGDGIIEPGEVCDDANNIDGDGCSANCQKECVGGCDDQNPCTNDTCNNISGLCVYSPNSGNSCNDGNLCTENDSCQSGTCQGSAKICTDGNACSTDSCDPVTGNCNNDFITCDDGRSCTTDSCNPDNGQCIFDTANCQCQSDGQCDDQNPCTNDSCDTNTGSCSHANNTASCDDGAFCNGTDQCSGGLCMHSGDPCASGGECANACDEAANSCNDPAGTACQDEGNICTDNQCDGNGACVPVNNDDPCDDKDPCTLGDFCSGGSCASGLERDCDDGIDCTIDTCDSKSEGGDCANDGAGCECLVDSDCDDGNPCTDEICNSQHDCEFMDNTRNCDDGLFCNGPDTCGAGVCKHDGDPCSGGLECANLCDEDKNSCNDPAGTSCQDDGNPCTDNACDGAGNCAPSNNHADCTDGNACTSGDICENGNCQNGSNVDCDDHRTCSADSCDTGTGQCVNDLSECPCDDDAQCNDSNPCTADSCDFAAGTCSNEPLIGEACDDGNQCTSGDLCSASGICSGNPVSCDDGDACTSDSCNASTGQCSFRPGSDCESPGEPPPSPNPGSSTTSSRIQFRGNGCGSSDQSASIAAPISATLPGPAMIGLALAATYGLRRWKQRRSPSVYKQLFRR